MEKTEQVILGELSLGQGFHAEVELVYESNVWVKFCQV